MRHLVVVVVVLAVVAGLAGSGPRIETATARNVAAPGWTLARGRSEFVRENRGYPVRWPACARPGTYVESDMAPAMTSFVQSGGGGFVLFESNQRHPSLVAATTHGHPHILRPVTFGGVTWHIYAYRSNMVILHVFPGNVTVVIEAPGSYAQGLHDAAAFSGVGVCL